MCRTDKTRIMCGIVSLPSASLLPTSLLFNQCVPCYREINISWQRSLLQMNNGTMFELGFREEEGAGSVVPCSLIPWVRGCGTGLEGPGWGRRDCSLWKCQCQRSNHWQWRQPQHKLSTVLDVFFIDIIKLPQKICWIYQIFQCLIS